MSEVVVNVGELWGLGSPGMILMSRSLEYCTSGKLGSKGRVSSKKPAPHPISTWYSSRPTLEPDELLGKQLVQIKNRML